jgi:hypothetical protein
MPTIGQDAVNFGICQVVTFPCPKSYIFSAKPYQVIQFIGGDPFGGPVGGKPGLPFEPSNTDPKNTQDSKSVFDRIKGFFTKDDEFKEEDHPRSENGQFGNKGEGTGSKEFNDLMGKEFNGVRGAEAVNMLLKEKRGHVKSAFHRNDIGDIDLVWGNEYFGLCHIIRRREEQGIEPNKFLSDITDVIEKGVIRKQNDRGNFEIRHNGKIAIISPELAGNKITFLLTAFKTRYK